MQGNRKESAKSLIASALGVGGVLSGVIYMFGYRNGVVTAGPYLAVLLFTVSCLIALVALLYGYIFPAISEYKKSKRNIAYSALGVMACLILFLGYKPFINLTTTTYYLLSGEDRIDAYLAEYKFEEARKANFAGNDSDRAENLKKITIAEAKFWAAEGEYDRALKVVDETWGMTDYQWKDMDWEEFRLSIIEDGIDKLCSEKRDFVKARLLAMKAKEYFRDQLNKKIDEYEKIVQ